jgi:hypothetical protein
MVEVSTRSGACVLDRPGRRREAAIGHATVVSIPPRGAYNVEASGATIRGSAVTANRLALMSLSFFVLTATATVAFAQFSGNTSSPALSGNTVNPVFSGESTLLPARSELSVSPSTPTGLLSNTTGTNPLTGLPCTGPGSLSISGAGTLPGSTSPAVNGSADQAANGTTSQIPAFPSVFQPGGVGGAC